MEACLKDDSEKKHDLPCGWMYIDFWSYFVKNAFLRHWLFFFLCLLILGEYGLIDLGFNNILDNVNYQVHTERK